MTKVQSNLLLELYQAPGDEAAWERFVASLTLAAGAVQGLFVHINSQYQNTSLGNAFNLDEEFGQAYEEYYQFRNPYTNLPSLLLPETGTFGLLNDLIPDREVERTEFFHDYVKPQNLTTRKAIRITPFQSDTIHTTLALHYARNQRGVDIDRALSICKTILPHLQTALRLHHTINGLNTRLDHLSGALDQMPLGMFLFDGTGRIIEINDPARCLLSDNDGLQLSHRKLSTALKRESDRLNELITLAAKTARRESLSNSGPFRVHRPSGKRAYELLITPVYEQLEVIHGQDCCVAVFVSDPEVKNESLGEILRHLYGLTQTEVRVTLMLVQGYDLKQIGEQFCIQRETLKTHLRHIFQKTGARRQGELISLVLRGPAPIIR